MKIQKLVIHNIASIEDATIDFSAAPLADSDVFLITGETGSGKSTILDAICLALYNNTPRMKNSKMEGAIDDAGKEVQVKSVAQLLREGTGEGSVTLTFEGSNGVPYEAKWAIARANKKPTGRLQAKDWSLRDLHSGTEYTKDAEIDAEIGRAVRLTFDQFCRTTMLAQGEFTRFLNSKDEEKAEILEMITGADIYSKIGAKVYELTQQKEKAFKAAQEAVEGIVLLSPEQREEKGRSVEERREQVQKTITLRDQIKAKAGWLVVEKDLATRVGDAKKELLAAQEAASSEEYLQEKAQLDAWKETQEARRSLETEISERAKAEGARKSIALMEDCYQKVRSGAQYLQERSLALLKEMRKVNVALDHELPVLSVIEKQQTVESQLGIINTGYEKILAWDGEIQEEEKKLNEVLNPAKETAEAGLSEAKAAKGKAKEALQAAEEALAKAGIPAIRAEITSLTTERGNIMIASERIVNHTTALTAYNNEGEAITTAGEELDKKKASRGTLSKEVEELAQIADQARLAYDTESTAMNNAVTAIRGKLTVGCTCPVCMQTIKTALPTDQEIAAKLRPLLEASEAAKANYENQKNKLGTLDATIAAEGDQLERRKTAYRENTSVADGYKAVMAALQACGIQNYDKETDTLLKKRIETIDTRLEELSTQEQKGQGLETAVGNARTADTKAGEALETARAACADADNRVKEANAELNQKKALRETRKKDVEAAEEIVNSIVERSRWGKTWLNDRDGFWTDLCEVVAAHQRVINKRDSLKEELGAVHSTDESIQGLLSEIETLVPAWKKLEALPAEELHDLEKTAKDLKDDILIEIQNEKIALRAASEAAEEVDTFLVGNQSYDRSKLVQLSCITQEKIDALKKHHKEVEESLLTAKASVETLTKQTDEHTAKRPVFEEGETLENLKEKEVECDSTVLALNSEATLLEQELAQDSRNAEKLGNLAAEAESLRETWVKWNRLNELVGDASGKRFRKIAQSYVLGSLVTAANHYMRELTDRYALKVVPGTFIISVEDAYQGYASRPASTISGGESFLVSLSLALALSDIGDTLSVDTLFIDEGFGTLSGAPLQNAVNTLKSLRTKAGRHVGIISHIEELQEKIPVRIQVEKSERTSSSSVRVVPEE